MKKLYLQFYYYIIHSDDIFQNLYLQFGIGHMFVWKIPNVFSKNSFKETIQIWIMDIV